MLDVVAKYGLVADGKTDNTPMLVKLAADLDAMVGQPLPKLRFSEGKFAFSAWPIRSANRLRLKGENTFLLHTGTGDAVTFDGGANGVFNCEFIGFTIIPGPHTQHGLVLKSYHHSRVEVRVHGAGPGCAAVWMGWNVCTEVRPVVSIVEAAIDGYAMAAPVPIVGVWLDANPLTSGNRTTACVIRAPILEGLERGMVIRGADLCTVDGAGGTIEDGVDGIVLGDDGQSRPGSHKIFNMEMEGNTGTDVIFASNAHNCRVVYSGSPALKVSHAVATLKELIPNNKVISTTDLL